MIGALVTAAAAAFALTAYDGRSEGTVVTKTDQGVYDYACQAGATVTGPVAVPVWGACSVPRVLAAGRPRRRRQHVRALRQP